jgi:hypothetical protein
MNSFDAVSSSVVSPAVVEDFSSCSGVPKHVANDPTEKKPLEALGHKHNKLLYLVEDIAEEDLT